MMWVAYIDLADPLPFGVFSDKAMALAWEAEDEEGGRVLVEVPNLDKTFATMAVEYNKKYEG